MVSLILILIESEILGKSSILIGQVRDMTNGEMSDYDDDDDDDDEVKVNAEVNVNGGVNAEVNDD